MEKSRYFNTIEIINDYTIKKSSKDKLKIKAEFEWYKNNTLFDTPNIYSYWEENDIASYTMEYIHGPSLARYFLYGNIPDDIIGHIFQNLYDCCIKDNYVKMSSNNSKIQIEHSKIALRFDNYTKMLIQSMYADKTFSRLAQTNIDIDREFIINGERTPTIRKIIEDCPVYINDSCIRHIHGDLCFSNILIEGEWQNPPRVVVIDPRGLLPDGTITNIGDVNYDVAKLAHSVIGRYDQIKDDNGFNIKKISEKEYFFSIKTSSWQKAFISEFYNHFSAFNYYNIMIHLFLSMIPLHADHPEHQEKMLVNALRLYLEKKED